MCSWCWGFSATLRTLEKTLPVNMRIVRVLGGLAEDCENAMPESMQHMLQQTWKQIETAIPGTQFNHSFWTSNKPRRSTWPSCRAVIAARNQDPTLEAPMIHAIQEAYYLQARNPSDTDVLIDIARHLGCDARLFAEQIHNELTRNTLLGEMRFSRELGAQGFPSLRVKTNQGQLVELPVNYNNPSAMLEQIEQTNLA
ncbi:MAG: putative protein-disulfide isomerase [Granulosicoccus sp.]|jgi:putative protein-disulfide isomerase